MRPVDARWPISQLFAGLATRGVVGRPNGTEVEYLVWLYGDYQPYGHAGVDIACPVGTPVVAMRAGTVVYSGWGEDLPGDDSWGPSGYFRRWGMYKNFPGIVKVIKADGVNEFDIYGHLSDSRPAPVGSRVAEGQLIALSGNTKTRTTTVGAHLHVVTVADPVNYSTNWPHIIFGCVDPTPMFGSTGLVLQGAITNAATTQAQEEDEKMLVIASDSGVNDGKVWIGDGVTRRHIPNPEILKAIQDHAKWGMFKIWKDGEVQNLPQEMLGVAVADVVPFEVNRYSTALVNGGISNALIPEIRGWTGAHADRVLEALKTLPQIDAALVDQLREQITAAGKESADAVRASLDNIQITLKSDRDQAEQAGAK